MEKLTRRQQEAAGALKGFIDGRGYPPTVRELAGIMKISVRAAFEHMGALEKKGIITRESGKSRSIILEESAGERTVEFPVLGRVPAGGPLLVEENITGSFSAGRELFGKGEFFVVEVEGESMTGAHIMPGDYAVARVQPEAGNGDIIVAVLDGETTIKRLSVKNGRATLLPENPLYEAIEPGDDFRVAGRVIGIIRRL